MNYRSVLSTALFVSVFSFFGFSQQAGGPQPDDYLTAKFHADRRQALRDLMPANSVAVIFSYPEAIYSRDVSYFYHPNPDLYYFSGYKEPNAVLLIFKEMQAGGDSSYNELFFVQHRDPAKESWTGRRLGVEGVKKSLGFKRVYTGEEFGNFPIDFTKYNVLYDQLPDTSGELHPGSLAVLTKDFVSKQGAALPGKDQYNFCSIALRGIKTPEELVLIKKAAGLSAIAHRESMRAVTPAMSERELEGIQLYIHKKYGSEEEGYPPIVGAGANSCILHYEENAVTRVGNQLVLMDVGAAYHGYSADVTRTFPANGKFTAEQKAIYQLVYDAQEAVFPLCRAGIPYDSLQKKTLQVLAAGLIKLGILKDSKDIKNFYPHGVSHHLGLDVHDKGTRKALQENMVITVEPGIYIPAGSACNKKWWNIGVRIEDDVIIGKNSCSILSAAAPRKWQEVEKTIAEKSIFDAANFPKLK